MDQNLDNIKTVTLWPTRIYVTNYAEDVTNIVNEIYKLSKYPNNIKKSNFGGWQSDTDLYKHAAFNSLCQHISTLCFDLFGKNITTIHQMWASVNKKHHYNAIHNHGSVYHISGVFYVFAPPNSGGITFRDPRPLATASIHRPMFDNSECETFTPYNGLLLLFPSYLDHFVEPNNSDSDRISISFDLTLKD
jgi:uncharacterized protein (TIGR02466 family)